MGSLSQLDAHHHQSTSVHFPVLTYTGTLDAVQDFPCSKCFGIDDAVNAHLPEELTILGSHVFGIVHACHRLAAAQCVSQHATCDVASLFGGDTYEQVGMGNTSFLQAADTGGSHVECHQVKVSRGGQICRFYRILIDEYDVLIFT